MVAWSMQRLLLICSAWIVMQTICSASNDGDETDERSSRTGCEHVVIGVSDFVRRESPLPSSASQQDSREDADETRSPSSSLVTMLQDIQEEDSDDAESQATSSSSSDSQRGSRNENESESENSDDADTEHRVAEKDLEETVIYLGPRGPAVSEVVVAMGRRLRKALNPRDDKMIELVKQVNELLRKDNALPRETKFLTDKFLFLVADGGRVAYRANRYASPKTSQRTRWRLKRLMEAGRDRSECCAGPGSSRSTAVARTRTAVPHIMNDAWQLLIRAGDIPEELLKLRLVCEQTRFDVDEYIKATLAGKMNGREGVDTTFSRMFDTRAYPCIYMFLLSQLINGGPWVDAFEDDSNVEGRARLIQTLSSSGAPAYDPDGYRYFCLRQCRSRSFLVNVLLEDDGIKKVYEEQMEECGAEAKEACHCMCPCLLYSTIATVTTAAILFIVSLFCAANGIPFGTCYAYGLITMIPIPLVAMAVLAFFIYRQTLCCGMCA